MQKILKSALIALALALTVPGASATNWYLDNSLAGASDSNSCSGSGSTPAQTPCASLNGASGILTKIAAGDVVFVGKNHGIGTADTTSGTAINFVGTTTNPVYFYCVDDSTWLGGTFNPAAATYDTPTSGTGGGCATFGFSGSAVTFAGSFYGYGLIFQGTQTTTANDLEFGQGSPLQYCENCEFILQTTSTSSFLQLQTGTAGHTILYNPLFKFGSSSQNINVVGPNGGPPTSCSYFIGSGITGTANYLATGSSTPTNFVAATGGCLIVDGGDWSGSTNLVSSSNGSVSNILLRNAKGNFSTNLFTGTGASTNMNICAENADTSQPGFALHCRNFWGTTDDDAANYRASGFSYNSTPFSYKLTTNANATFQNPLISQPIDIGHLNSGSSTTITVYFMFDGSAGQWNKTQLTDHDIWFDIGYDGTSSSGLRTWTNNRATAFPNTAVNQGSTGGSWTTSGVTTAEQYSMSLTFTPQAVGHYTLRVYVNGSGAAQKVWIDPAYTCTGNCS